jgi:hypothetical protein
MVSSSYLALTLSFPTSVFKRAGPRFARRLASEVMSPRKLSRCWTG